MSIRKMPHCLPSLEGDPKVVTDLTVRLTVSVILVTAIGEFEFWNCSNSCASTAGIKVL